MTTLLLFLFATLSFATQTPKVLQDIKIEQKIGSRLDPSLNFKIERGPSVSASDLKSVHPSIFVFSYGDCKTLCSMVLNGLIKGINDLPPGGLFNVFVLSIDPNETQENLKSRKSILEKRLLNKNAKWNFLTADEPTIQKAAKDLGFHYRYDEKSKQYAHASGIIFLTPDLRVSGYLMGIEYAPEKIKEALRIAGTGAKGNFVEEILLYCFHYDPETSPYGILVVNSLRIAGVLTLMCLGVLLLSQKRRRA